MMRRSLRKNYLLSDLIPQNTLFSEFNSSISKYQNIVNLACDAIAAFENRKMHFFDPIVGDCACQIRALIFASLINEKEIDNYISYFKSAVEEHLFSINDLIKAPSALTQVSLQEYLNHYGLNFEIPEDITIIILSYIISLIKIPETYMSEDGILSYRAQTRISIPKYPILKRKFIDQIIKRAQQELTRLSVNYIQELVIDYDKKEKKFLENCFKRFDHLDRSLLPCYPQTRVIIDNLIKNKIPIILRLDMFITHETHAYNSFELIFNNPKEDSCNKENPSELNEKSAFVISAKSINKKPICPNKLQAKLRKHGIKDLLLSAVAAHPQYPHGEIWQPIDPEYENYARLALKLGTCRANPSACLIDHIYCDIYRTPNDISSPASDSRKYSPILCTVDETF